MAEHSEVIEVEDKWAVVCYGYSNQAIVFKGKIQRGALGPVGKMTDYLHPGMNVVVNVRWANRRDVVAKREGCNWVVTKIDREKWTVLPPNYYLDLDNLFVFKSGQLGKWTGEAVMVLRTLLKSWNGISLTGIMDNLKEAKPVIRTLLGSLATLRQFVESQPRFFTLTSRDFVYLNGGLEAADVREEIKSRVPRLHVGTSFGDGATIIRKPWHVAGVIKPIIRDEDYRIIAFDTERTSQDEAQCLSTVQIAIMDEEYCHAFIFDVLNWSPKNFKTSKLKQLLESENVLKVVHDCRGDSAVLENYNMELKNVFDTAVAYTSIMEQCNVGYTPPTNMTNLCELFGSFTPKRNSKSVYYGNPNFWAQRPFTQNMIDHAASDVMGLATHVYDNMNSFMSSGWKTRFDAMCSKSLGH